MGRGPKENGSWEFKRKEVNKGARMPSSTYPPPVDQLLTVGDCQKLTEWPNYLELGLGLEHAPDLVRMAMDEGLNYADSDSLEVWAPVHAWRALGQLHAESAVPPPITFVPSQDSAVNQRAGC